AAWLPDGSVVVTDETNATRFSADGKKLTEYVAAQLGKSEAKPWVVGLTISPDGKTVVLAGEGAPEGGSRSQTGWATVFDAATGTKRREWQSKDGAVTAAAFMPDGSRV